MEDRILRRKPIPTEEAAAYAFDFERAGQNPLCARLFRGNGAFGAPQNGNSTAPA